MKLDPFAHCIVCGQTIGTVLPSRRSAHRCIGCDRVRRQERRNERKKQRTLGRRSPNPEGPHALTQSVPLTDKRKEPTR